MSAGRRAESPGRAAPRGGPVLLAAALIGLALLPGTSVGAASGAEAWQEARRLAVAVHPAEVKVGEPFTLGITVRVAPGTRVVFPAWLEGDEHLEQLAPAEIRSEDGGTTRAYYRLAVWRAGETALPGFAVSYGDPAAERSIPVGPPDITVRSVLPAERDELELRGARPFLQAPSPIWPWLLAAALLLSGAWIVMALLRRRGRIAPPTEESAGDPVDRAVAELKELRRGWTAGELDGAAFYDGWESTLRWYVRTTRGWAPGRPLPPLADGDLDLARSFRRSALVRFARVGADPEGPGMATDAAVSWVRADGDSADEGP